MDLEQAARRAAKAIRSMPRGTRWFIDCDTDADGMCGAAVMGRALGRIGHRFQVRASRDKTREAYQALAAEACDGYLLIDKGSSHADELAQLARDTGRPVIIIDHHNVTDTPADVLQVNPRLEGLDGSRDASAATTAVAVALALDEGNLDMAPIGLSGAVGDWQHDGGWRGWNEILVERCLAAGHLRHEPLPALVGADLADAVSRRLDVDGAAWLAAIDIDGTLDAEDLDVESRTRLVSAWTLHDLANGKQRDRVHEALWNTRLDTGVRHAFRIIDACGRLGDIGAGLAFALTGRRGEAMARFQEYKQRLRTALGNLRTHGTEVRQAMQWARTEHPELTGMVAGIAMVHIVDDTTRPLVVTALRPDGDVQVSTRGTHAQVEAGMDLGRAIQDAAATIDLEGGGHPIASGAVVPAERLDDLLDALDTMLVAQQFV